jgi:hypothetical protein
MTPLTSRGGRTTTRFGRAAVEVRHHLGQGQRGRFGVGLTDGRVDLDAVPQLAVARRHHPHSGLADRFSFYAPYKMSPEDRAGVLAGFHSD